MSPLMSLKSEAVAQRAVEVQFCWGPSQGCCGQGDAQAPHSSAAQLPVSSHLNTAG